MEEMSTLRKYRVTDLIETVRRGGSIAARHVLLVPIENADSMMVLSVALAWQAGERLKRRSFAGN